MFDEVPQKNIVPPSNLPTEPVDMFAAVEGETAPSVTEPSAVDAGLLRKKAPGVQTPPSDSGDTQVYAVNEPILGKVLMVMLILVIAGAVGYGGWRLYSYLTASPAVETPVVVDVVPAEPVVPAPVIEPLPEEVPPTTTEPDANAPVLGGAVPTTTQQLLGEQIDTDKDGLNDTREEELGTGMNNPDSDADGLSDGDEVLIWKTNPLNSDTDGDSYIDGEEVRNGYNPLGPGKIFVGENPAATNTPAATTTPATTTDSEPAL